MRPSRRWWVVAGGGLLAVASPGRADDPPDLGSLIRQAASGGPTAEAAALALRYLPPDALAPVAADLARETERARRTALDARRAQIALLRPAAEARKGAIDDARAAAKKLIRTYDYAQQPEVDRLVGAVRAIWERPVPVEGLDTAAFREARDRWAMFRDLLGRARGPGEAGPDLAAEVAAADAREIPLLFVRASDRKLLEALLERRDPCDLEEAACIDATNWYRLMMGEGALRMDPKLVLAARQHSESMVRLGFFSHTSPVKGYETFGARAGKAGTGAKSENIAQGQATGKGAFDGWYHSPGHHRNILGSATTIGVGRHATHWTQMFG